MMSTYRIPYFVAANLLNLALPLVIISAMSKPRGQTKSAPQKEQLEDKSSEEEEEEEEESILSDKKND